MPTATGTVYSASSGTKFIAKFEINGITHNFTGNLSPSIQTFNATTATLTYSDTMYLTSSRDFSGRIGKADLDIIVEPKSQGITIKGDLDNPINPASTISGTGTWTQN